MARMAVRNPSRSPLQPSFAALLATVTALVAVALAPAAARADEAKAAADVKAAVRSFGQAVYKGDATAARALVVPSDTSDKLVDGLAAMTTANEKFAEAMTARFKEEAARERAAGGSGVTVLRWITSVDAAAVKVEGDAATLQPPPITVDVGRGAPGVAGKPGAGARPGAAAGQRSIPTQPIHLKKIDGTWRIDLSQIQGISEDPVRAAQLFSTMAKAYADTAVEVKDGKYATAREAHQAVARKVYTASNAGGPGKTGGPAPQPAPRGGANSGRQGG